MPEFQVPLLADHHSHPLLYAALQKAVDLSEVFDLEEACDLISQAAAKDDQLTVAHGWKDQRFNFSVDRLAQLPPLAIFNVSLHQLLMNSKGRNLLTQTYGDDIHQIDDRLWYETHLPTVLNWFANLTGSAEALHNFYDHLERLGVWSAEEMLLVDEREIEWFQTTELIDRTKFWSAPETFATLSQAARHVVTGLKFFTDGALGARSAAIQQPYSDAPTSEANRGMLIHSDSQLLRQFGLASQTQKSIAIHAIGDRAIEQTLTTLERLGGSRDQFPNIRLEHAQLINLQQAKRAKQMGVVLSMQPNFNSDSVDYKDRLPVDYPARNNPFRMLIDQVEFQPGVDLLFGSDGMPHGAKFALQQALFPKHEQQRLTLDEFVAGYGSQTAQMFHVSVDPPNQQPGNAL